MRLVLLGGVALAGVLCGSAWGQETGRHTWAAFQEHIDFDRYLQYSLRDAPLTTDEKAQIYSVVDRSIHVSSGDAEREEERSAVLSARVGLIVLAGSDRRQVLVRGTSLKLCGLTGNCAFWVFVREREKVRLILSEEGKGLIAGDGSYQGFTDLVVPFHDSAFETSFSVYRWNRLEYKRTDCYLVASDPSDPEKAPVIRDCAAPPR